VTKQWNCCSTPAPRSSAGSGLAVKGGHGSGLLESNPGGFCFFPSDPDLESTFFETPVPVSSEISDLLLFFSKFASQNKEIKSGNSILMCVV